MIYKLQYFTSGETRVIFFLNDQVWFWWQIHVPSHSQWKWTLRTTASGMSWRWAEWFSEAQGNAVIYQTEQRALEQTRPHPNLLSRWPRVNHYNAPSPRVLLCKREINNTPPARAFWRWVNLSGNHLAKSWHWTLCYCYCYNHYYSLHVNMADKYPLCPLCYF